MYQYYYHSDHLGSSSLITNLDGDIVQHIEYVPFGEVFIEERNSKWNTPYLFNAKELDEETELYYYGARYYDPRISIFYGVDPLAEKTGTPYQYCYQNPIKFIDPTGMEGEDGGHNPSLKMGRHKIEEKSGGLLDAFIENIKDVFGFGKRMEDHSTPEKAKESQAFNEDQFERMKSTEEGIHTVNESMLSFIPFGSVGYNLYADREITGSGIGIEIVGVIPVGKIATKSGSLMIKAARFAKLDKHYVKHVIYKNEWFGIMSKVAYNNRAVKLADSPVGGVIEGFISKGGTTFKYNKQTNEFLTMKPNGIIETFYRPERGRAYYLEQIEKYGK